jgi:hypothetical protein
MNLYTSTCEINKSVNAYDRRGHKVSTRLVIAGSELSVRSKVYLYVQICMYIYVRFYQ